MRFMIKPREILKSIIFILISLVVLGGTNDTALAANQAYVVFAFLLYLIYRSCSGHTLQIKVGKYGRNVLVVSIFIFVWMIIGLFNSLDVTFSLRLCLYFLIYVLIMIFPLGCDDYKKLFKVMEYCCTLLAISIIASAIFGQKFIDLFSSWFNDYDRILKDIRYGQYSGLIGDRAFASMAMCTAIYLQISKILANHKIMKKDVMFTGLYLAALMLTGKRITLLMIGCGVIVCMLFSNDRRVQRTIVRVLLIIVFVALIALVAIPQTQVLFDRVVSGLGDTTFNDRLKFWNVALEMLSNKPISGYGLGSFLTYNQLYGTGIKQYAHNMYLQFLAEIGIVGFALMIIIFGYILYLSIKLIRMSMHYKSEPDMVKYAYFSIFVQVGFLVYGLTGYPFYNLQQGVLYAICAGLSLSLCSRVPSYRRITL